MNKVIRRLNVGMSDLESSRLGVNVMCVHNIRPQAVGQTTKSYGHSTCMAT